MAGGPGWVANRMKFIGASPRIPIDFRRKWTKKHTFYPDTLRTKVRTKVLSKANCRVHSLWLLQGTLGERCWSGATGTASLTSPKPGAKCVSNNDDDRAAAAPWSLVFFIKTAPVFVRSVSRQITSSFSSTKSKADVCCCKFYTATGQGQYQGERPPWVPALALLACVTTVLFFEFSLCLSRACLGKMIIFIYKWRNRRVFI
jgi:hypothetical protein